MTTVQRASVTVREFDEALDRLEDLLDVAGQCPDGDDCDDWRDECPYHRAVDLLASYRGDEGDET